jgi:APA family basic amino acid/polyamine antiporter
MPGFNIEDTVDLSAPTKAGESSSLKPDEPSKEDDKERKIGLLQAVSLNTLMMFGTGPFITIPFCIASSDPAGPQALIGYAIGAMACCCDSFIWAELGALFPYSGGSYIYAQKCLGEKWGKYVSFLFLWQLLITGPMEIASGFIAVAEYLAYVTQIYTYAHHTLIAFGCCIICTVLLYRDISDVGTVAVILWVGMCCAIAFTLIAGFSHFNEENFEIPPITNTGTLIWSLGNCAKFGVYDFTGYHDVNFIGKDVKNPQRIIPLAGISTCIIVCIIYFLTYLAVMSYLPWDPKEDGFVKLVNDDSNNAAYIMAIFCQELVNRNFGIFFTFVVIYCIFGSCYSLMLGFAQVPYAAAKSGSFFDVFGHEHRKGFADYSLLYMGFCTCVFCFVDLETLIEGMLTTMILTMYMSNSLSLVYHRWTQPDCERPYKMPLYPLPVIVQVLMFSFIFLTSDNWIFSRGTPLLELGILFLSIGTVVFLIQSKKEEKWPFAKQVCEIERYSM